MTLTEVNNRSAFSQRAGRHLGRRHAIAGDYPDDVWKPDTVRHYFDNISGSGSPDLFNDFFTFDFETVRAARGRCSGQRRRCIARRTIFTTDRRTEEKSKSAYVQYSQTLETARCRCMPRSACATRRRTSLRARWCRRATGINWVANNEFSRGHQSARRLHRRSSGEYDYVLPSLDFAFDVHDNLKLRASYGKSIGRPGWGDIQGGQTLEPAGAHQRRHGRSRAIPA